MSDMADDWSPGSGSSAGASTATGMIPAVKATVFPLETPWQDQERRPAAAPAAIRPKISMRPITTPINILVCGASSTGKSRFIQNCAQLLTPGSLNTVRLATATSIDDPCEVLLARADDFATTLQPILVPEAGRALVYRFQDSPGYGASLDPAGYLEALLTFIYRQQERDYTHLRGSRVMHKSLACLTHSITAALYFLQPHGPTKLDLVMMAALSKRVALVPVVGKADAMDAGEAAACTTAVWHMLAAAQDYVAGLKPIEPYRLYGGGTSTTDPILPLLGKMTGLKSLESQPLRSADGLTQLAELLTGDEVFGLLDFAWDKYNEFCDSCEGLNQDQLLGDRLGCLVDVTRKADIAPFLAGAAALQDMKKQLAMAEQEAQELRKDLATESRMLDELCDVLKAFKEAVCSSKGYGSYDNYLVDESISADLKQRLPKLSLV